MSIDFEQSQRRPAEVTGNFMTPESLILRRDGEGNVYHGYLVNKGTPPINVLVKELVLPSVPTGPDDLSYRLAEFMRREDTLLREELTKRGIGPICYGLITTDLPDGREVLSLVMEDIPGKDLLHAMEETDTWTDEARKLFAKKVGVSILTELAAAQDVMGLVHRDIKPANIMVDLSDLSKITIARLIDFGLAVTQWEYPQLDDRTKNFGSPGYSAPEQDHWQDPTATVDGSTDVYAIGLVLAEIMAGSRSEAMYDGRLSDFQIETENRDFIMRGVRNGHIPQEFGSILLKATNPNKAQRYQSAQEMLDAVQALAIF